MTVTIVLEIGACYKVAVPAVFDNLRRLVGPSQVVLDEDNSVEILQARLRLMLSHFALDHPELEAAAAAEDNDA